LVKRAIYDDLLAWKASDGRKPLLLEGVRQCGKTYILNEFGRLNYDSVAYFTFEENPDLSEIFERDLEPMRIVNRLSLIGPKIEPGKTLIILDEIQFCNRALASLKFFCEDAPEYHVACAGSLLGVLTSKPYSFPVGKVDRLKMYPMTFKEFLLANSEDRLVEHIERNGPEECLTGAIANRLGTHLDNYFLTGGMPAAVASWIDKGDIREVDRILDKIIGDYKQDFSKHATESLTKLTLIWDSVPLQLAKTNDKFMFGHVKTGMRSKDLEDALEWLLNAGLVHKVKKVSRPDIPLPMFADSTSFKVYSADVGILRRMAEMPSDFMFSKDKKYDLFRGAVAENYVLNELMASLEHTPYYWRSDATAEVDFIAQVGRTVVPIEVKAGGGNSKSLAEFIKKYDPEIAVTTSSKSGRSSVVVHIPLYAVWNIRDYVLARTAGTALHPP